MRSPVVAADLLAWQLAGGGEPDPAELDPGLFVCVNVDDDPQNLQTLTLDVLSDDELADQVRIAWTNDAKVDVFSDPQGTVPVVSEEERTFDLAELPLELYVEGVAPSAALRDVEFTLDYLHEGTVLHTDLIKATVLEVDLDIADVTEEDEETPGLYMCLNDDDDDGDGVPDYDDGYNKDGIEGNADDANRDEDDLVALTLREVLPTDLTGTVTLTKDEPGPGDWIKVWTSATKGEGNEVSQLAEHPFAPPGGLDYHVDVIDTWEMTINTLESAYSGEFTIELPARPHIAVRLRRA